MSSPTSLPSTRVCAVKFVPGLRSLRSPLRRTSPFSVTAVSGWSRSDGARRAESDGHSLLGATFVVPKNCRPGPACTRCRRRRSASHPRRRTEHVVDDFAVIVVVDEVTGRVETVKFAAYSSSSSRLSSSLSARSAPSMTTNWDVVGLVVDDEPPTPRVEKRADGGPSRLVLVRSTGLLSHADLTLPSERVRSCRCAPRPALSSRPEASLG